MLRIIQNLASVLFLGLILQASVLSAADDDEGKPPPPLPADKNLWINATPYSWEQMRGKGVCLYFFECDSEGVELLPKYIESARAHAADPVVFIGVALGKDKFNTEQFLRGTKVNFPIVCDPIYSFARQCDTAIGVKPGDGIVDSVCYAAYTTADGKLYEGWFDDPEENVTEALYEAKWTTDPKEVPEAIKPLWRAIEFRKFTEALPLIRAGVKSGPDEQKEAARKLQQVVLDEIEQLAKEAREADEADQKWIAYTKASCVLDDFKGYEIPKDLEPLKKKLARSSEVKAGITAEKQLPQIAQNLKSNNASIRGKARTQLQKIKEDFADSDLAKKAQELLDGGETMPK